MTLDLMQAAVDVAKTVDADHLGTGAVVAVASAEIIQIIKTSGLKMFAWINVDSQTVNRVVGGLVAFITGLGISWSYDAATGTLVVNGLLAASISHAFIQWAQMQAYYRLVIAKGAK
jgi:hypothetical protein